MRMTLNRKRIIEKMYETNLYFEFLESGSEHYFFADSSEPNQSVIRGLLACGYLKKTEGLLGAGQEIVIS